MYLGKVVKVYAHDNGMGMIVQCSKVQLAWMRAHGSVVEKPATEKK